MHLTLTGIAAILGRDDADASSKLDLMLAAMETRGTIIAKSIVKGKRHTVGIGSCSHPNQELPALRPEETSIVIDGQVPDNLGLDVVGGQVDELAISDSLDSGPFSCLAIFEGKLLAARDLLGQKPLYFGRGPRDTLAFGSLKTALTTVQVSTPLAVPPGRVIGASGGRTSVVANKSLVKPRSTTVPEDEASSELRQMLVDSLARDASEDLALAFSGGLDSTLVAKASTENALRPELITVGMKGQPEIKHARTIARIIGLDITVKELSPSDILTSLPEVVRTIESVDPILVGISVPLFFACEVAEEMGTECLLAGQLSDELFAGYGRFDDFAQKGDNRGARDEIWRSVLAASTNDFEPGDKLAVSHRLELRCPFAHLPLVEYALRLPIHLKLRVAAGRIVRKFILRRVAKDWMLPEDVVNRPKKAVQYSTGVQKILLKEAKRTRMTLARFLQSLR